MKKSAPLLAVTALSAQLFIVGTARAESTEAPAASPEGSEPTFSLVSAVRTGAKAAKKVLDDVDAAAKPKPAPVVRTRPSGNGKAASYDAPMGAAFLAPPEKP
ncbi:MAG TPA: hypothetical protein VL400_10460 [Polyangiaceae bacterium]|nr:hypothetical protein [Polyangiaceae bacterium]